VSARVHGGGVSGSEREQVFDVCSQDSLVDALLPDGVRGQNTPGSRKVLELPCREGAELIPALCIVPMVGHRKTFQEDTDGRRPGAPSGPAVAPTDSREPDYRGLRQKATNEGSTLEHERQLQFFGHACPTCPSTNDPQTTPPANLKGPGSDCQQMSSASGRMAARTNCIPCLELFRHKELVVVVDGTHSVDEVQQDLRRQLGRKSDRGVGR
jgi:hypothetical protein